MAKRKDSHKKAAVPPEYDLSVKLDDHVAQAALKRIAAAGLADKVAAGHHAWVLNFNVGTNKPLLLGICLPGGFSWSQAFQECRQPFVPL